MKTFFSLAALALVAGSAVAAQPAIGENPLPNGMPGRYEPLDPVPQNAFQPNAYLPSAYGPNAYGPNAFQPAALQPPAYPPAYPSPAFGTPGFPPGYAPAGFAAPALLPPVAPAIKYVHHGRVPECARCLTPIETVLEVKVPCGCTTTTVPVPVCLPACCTDAPQVTWRDGLSGREVVRYDYCCGVSVKIVVRPSGGIVVHYIHA